MSAAHSSETLLPLTERPLLDAQGQLDAEVVNGRRTVRIRPDGSREYPQWDSAGDIPFPVGTPVRFGGASARRTKAGWRFEPVVPTAALLAAAAAANITYVPQPHRRGCVPAAVAMIAGMPYAAALRELGGPPVFLHGVTDDTAAALLDAVHLPTRAWPFRELRSAVVSRPSLLGVRMRGGGRHAVVLLPGGTILDPLVDIPTHLGQYAGLTFLREVLPPEAR